MAEEVAEEVAEEEVEEEAEKEAEEEAAEQEEEDKQTPWPRPASDSAETPQKYSQETGKKQTASSPNSNATT